MMAEAFPVMMVCAPRMIALRLEAQTLLTVVHTVEVGRPAPIAHCLAGFCPKLYQGGEFIKRDLGRSLVVAHFAEMTLPKKTSSTSSGFTKARSRAAITLVRPPCLCNEFCDLESYVTLDYV